jgi:uncharacterized protein (TIGR02001 family)
MIKLRIAAAAALLAVSGAAAAGNVSATVSLVSDYDFRGVTQTLNDWTPQLGLTWTADNGMYYGIWGSDVDFQGSCGSSTNLGCAGYDRPSTEVDVFAGFSGENVVAYDLGVIYYSYPNAGSINSPEVYAGINKGPVGLKVWYSWDWAGSGKYELYTEGNVNVPMGENFSFLGHVGYSKFDPAMGADNYYDWAAGFGYSMSNFDLSFKWVDGSNIKLDPSVPRNLGRFVFGASTTLPWGE